MRYSRIRFFPFVFLLFGFQAIAQEKSVSVTPVILTSGIFGAQPGFEFTVNKDLSILTEIAIPLWNPDRFRNLTNTKIFRLSSELRFRPGTLPRYISLQAGYMWRNLSYPDSGRFVASRRDDTGFVYSSAEVRSPVIFSALKFSKRYSMDYNFFVEFFVSAGLRYSMTEIIAKGTAPATGPTNRWIHGFPSWDCNCDMLRFHGTFGIRIGKKL